jgi:hypothetical protein
MSSENPSGADNQQETSMPRVPVDPTWIDPIERMAAGMNANGKETIANPRGSP